MPGRFKTVKKGFDVSQVDEYIQTVENVIRSYEEKSAAIDSAIKSAQQTADSIIKKAEEEADRVKLEAVRTLKDIGGSVLTQKKLAKEFHDTFNATVHKYVMDMAQADVAALDEKIDNFKGYVAQIGRKPEPAPKKERKNRS
jgi:F0F1-type ATP synthase membrane subunit b/b'